MPLPKASPVPQGVTGPGGIEWCLDSYVKGTGGGIDWVCFWSVPGTALPPSTAWGLAGFMTHPEQGHLSSSKCGSHPGPRRWRGEVGASENEHGIFWHLRKVDL